MILKLCLPLFLLSTTLWGQLSELTRVLPDSIVYNQRFATQLAIDDNLLVVSSEKSYIHGVESNVMYYIYERNNSGKWEQKQILLHEDPENYTLGHTVAIYKGFVFCSVRGLGNKNFRYNSVLVFSKSESGKWQPIQELKLQGNYQGGYGYQILAKNDKLIISATGYGLNPKSEKANKHADIYCLENGTWIWHSELLSDDLKQYNFLEPEIAFNGEEIFVKGYFSDPNEEPVWFCTITVKDEKGKVIGQKSSPCESKTPKVFVYSLYGKQWRNTQVIRPWGEKAWGFGDALTAHGAYLVISGNRASFIEGKNLAGALYVYKKNQKGAYLAHQRIVANDVHKTQLFGTDLTMNDQYLIVGSKDDKMNANGNVRRDRTGACYVFQKREDEQFMQTQKFISDERQKMGHFGQSIYLNGNDLAIGSGYKSVKPKYRGSHHNEGAAFVTTLYPSVPSKGAIEPIVTAMNSKVILEDGQQINLEEFISIYPNPSKGSFTLHRNADLKSEVILYAGNGQEVGRWVFEGQQKRFQISNIKAGLYYVRVFTEGKVQNLKLILID